MTQANDTCRGGRLNAARRPGAGRIATRRTRVSSDAVISAYIHDIARPHAGGEQHDTHPVAAAGTGTFAAQDIVTGVRATATLKLT